jgi:uncharacterized OB-fold protein
MIIPEACSDTLPFWEAANENRLLLRYCESCQGWLHPQTTVCGCGTFKLEWREASGEATLVSYTVTHSVPVSALVEELPFTLLLVRLAEGPQLVSALLGEGHILKCGMSMRVWFDRLAEGVTLVRFKPIQ